MFCAKIIPCARKTKQMPVERARFFGREGGPGGEVCEKTLSLSETTIRKR